VPLGVDVMVVVVVEEYGVEGRVGNGHRHGKVGGETPVRKAVFEDRCEKKSDVMQADVLV